MSTILVTGASGFIGSFIVSEGLRLGYEVWAGMRGTSSRSYLQDERIRFAELDLSNPARLAGQLQGYKSRLGDRGWDYVVHAAGATKCLHPEDFFRTNTDGTRNLIDGLPKNVTVTAAEVREALADPLQKIVEAIRLTLENTPPELASDIIDRGITLTGGGALLRGIDKLIHAETSIPVHIADNPLDCVVEGTRKRLEANLPFDTYDKRRKY